MTSLAGDTPRPWHLPGYVVLGLLGRGGFGEVWSGRVKSTGRGVALKRISVNDAAERKAARIEAAMMSALEHPNLLTLHEVISTRNHIVLVMDLAAQGSLRDVLARRGHLTPGEVTYLISTIANAVSYAHNVGVIHGDITPGNILFNSLATPFLGDLGVARIVGEFAPIVTTAPYIDPAVAGGAPPGKPSDIFMLAATAIHCLTGQPLWRGTDTEVIRAASSAQSGFAKAQLALIQSPITQVIARALSPEPACRPTAAEFALDLRASCTPVPVDLEVGRSQSSSGALSAAPRVGAHRRPVEPHNGPVVTRAVNPALPPVPIGRWRRIAATARYRRRELLRVLTVAATVGAISTWYAQSVSRSSGSVLTAPVVHTPVLHTPVAQMPSVTAAGTRPVEKPEAPAEKSDAGKLQDQVPTGQNQVPTKPVDDLGETLRRVDAVREQAYAANDPSLLTQAYLPGSLLEQDIGTMSRLIPVGCGLYGVRTSYTNLQQETSSDATLQLVVTASLPTSTLRCPNRPPKQVAGHLATRLRITLVDDGVNYRFSAQQFI